MLRPLILALSLASGVLAGTPVAASPGAPVAKVRYGDLDLASAQGAQVLNARIDNALRRVCDYNPQERQPALRKAAERCIAETRVRIALPASVASRVAAR